jgi:alpha-glucuronidase
MKYLIKTKNNYLRSVALILVAMLSLCHIHAENGYRLWLRYNRLPESCIVKYAKYNHSICCPSSSATLLAARKELAEGIKGLLGTEIKIGNKIEDGAIVAGTPETVPFLSAYVTSHNPRSLESEGYVIRSAVVNTKRVTVIVSNTDIGVLYGVFRYLRLLQTRQDLKGLSLSDYPRIRYRVLNHWDNMDGTIERGYAGYSLWDWYRLPYYIDQRYIDYARANASIGINGSVLNNVNASAKILKTEWLVKVAALADAFRPYGIRVYLTAKFSSPQEIGGLATSSPKDPKVIRWWRDKVKEIYSLIPDFGGFLVKANSEGQPGPQDYGCSHADGANMLGDALAPYGGVVFWRAFVYENKRNVDRAVSGYREFKPLDGQFHPNVFVQPKNGPIDFQPREPFNPLFGQMPNTALSMEFEITQEYLGWASHLVYLGPLFSETLQSDTYEHGKGSTVSRVLQDYEKTKGMSGMAGVSNIGTDINWTGHPFGQANWYAFGRLAWNPDLSPKSIAEEWIRMTFSNKDEILRPVLKMMMMSREAAVDYMMPLGLNHIMNFSTHYGPEPWHNDPVWTAYDYHKVTKDSIGVDRTEKGSNAVGQYNPHVKEEFNDIHKCPESFLLWFHRVPWSYRLSSGGTLWNGLVTRYYKGVDEVRQMQSLWKEVEGKIDQERFSEVSSLLTVQEREAEWWRDACVLFFQQYSGLPLPEGCLPPEQSLDYYMRIPFPYNWHKTKLFRK